ncbi:hypothetical protein BOTBODRAFT_26171 [Botryobasidium botryosum FD-172 SS1]|uniref:Transcription factor n=1 Tax=Botryobasidium botryosum (strain FD-172 SS1) TaxID=930990 RepID=A0A067N1K6_BOTB1|nr:hypothetical protein BOTBODRAFT_26171 [Botryobasidium botryosum FD-172 SS1]
MSLKAIVKSVLSGDTLVLRGRPGPQGQPPKERILHIADVSTPKMGSSQRDDEPFAYESREFIRALAVGKEISFVSNHSLPTNDDVPRDIGRAEVNGVDLATELLRSGWAKVKEGSKREPTDEDAKRKALEDEAKAAGKGLWNPENQGTHTVHYVMPADSHAFLTEWKGKWIDGIVEQVRDGSTLRVRLLLPDNVHQLVNVQLAGIRSPRAGGREGEAAEEFGEEAKFFTESRLLQRSIRVQPLSLPAPSATPFASSSSPLPPAPASVIIGVVSHPAGNIAEFLVAAGLARVVDWHAGMLAPSGGMEKLRAAERSAKEKRAFLYANAPAANNGTRGAGPAGGPASRGQFEAQVVRVWSGDQISIVDKASSKETRVQLSSLRSAKANDPKQAWYAAEAKEFLRKRLIGKTVRVTVDFIKPREGEYEERECVTIRVGGSNANIAEQLIEKGLATALRHKRDDENRSPDYDKLMAAEQAAAAESRGLHSGKEIPIPRVGNASETSAKATQFLSAFKRAGRIPAVVDYVAAGSRFKVLIPKENQTLTLVLSGIRAPRTARNPSEKSEPFGAESLEFASRRYLQRDVEVEFEAVDKSGGFIGALYLNKTENAAVALVAEGLATVHAYSAEALPWAKQLFDAEEEAKKEQKNIWKDYDAAADAEQETTAEAAADPSALKAEYIDVIISDIRPNPNAFTFSVQRLTNGGNVALEKLMSEFKLFHRTASAPASFTPRGGELVSAIFSGDKSWYRAKVKRSSPSKKEAELVFIDYGNQETVPFSSIRPLDPKFRALPGQAQDARLSFIKPPAESTDYHQEALYRFRDLCENRTMIANVDSRDSTLLHLRLFDPKTGNDPACVNVDLVREGHGLIDRRECRYVSSYPAVEKKLLDALDGAKRDRFGMFEFGDVTEDD